MDLAYNKKLGLAQARIVAASIGTSLHENPLVCAKCGHEVSMVNFDNCCDACSKTLKKAERVWRQGQVATHYDDFYGVSDAEQTKFEARAD